MGFVGAVVPVSAGVGFDDIEHCAWDGLPMTTVHRPFAEMGVAAAQLGWPWPVGERPTRRRVPLGAVLVVRGARRTST